MMSKKLLGVSGLIIALVLLIGINIISNAALAGKRVDLTENKLYTLSEGSKNLVGKLEDPITLRFYFSEKLATGIPSIKNYGLIVRELLQEYEKAANGKLRLEIIDPIPFTEAEERAVQAGLQGAPIRQGENIYFGLEGVSTIDTNQVIPFFIEDRQDFLEYDISSLIYNLHNPDKRSIAIITDLPIEGTPSMNPMMRRPEGNEPWVILQTLRQSHEVQVLPLSTTELPEGIDLLMMIHPKGVSNELQYAIDQYVLKGGNLMAFVDAHAEVDEPNTTDQNQMLQAMMAPRASDLPDLFRAWGIELVPERVAADLDRAQPVQVGQQTRPEIVNFVLYQSLRPEDINDTEVVTSNLQAINVGMPGILRKIEGAKTEFVPLLQTSEKSMQMEANKAQVFPQPKELLSEFVSEDKRQVLAARVSGNVESAFPQGPNGETAPEGHVASSSEPINVVVFADVDMLSDRFWVQVQRFLGQSVLMPIANNGDLVANAVDYLSGSNDLIAIRSRGRFVRPFKVVQELQQKAQERAGEREKELQTRLEETEQRLQELQAARQDGGRSLILTPEQQEEIEKFRELRVETSRELRKVQAELRRDVESLGTRLKMINIGLVPLAVGLVAVGLGMFRASRRYRR